MCVYVCVRVFVCVCVCECANRCCERLVFFLFCFQLRPLLTLTLLSFSLAATAGTPSSPNICKCGAPVGSGVFCRFAKKKMKRKKKKGRRIDDVQIRRRERKRERNTIFDFQERENAENN